HFQRKLVESNIVKRIQEVRNRLGVQLDHQSHIGLTSYQVSIQLIGDTRFGYFFSGGSASIVDDLVEIAGLDGVDRIDSCHRVIFIMAIEGDPRTIARRNGRCHLLLRITGDGYTWEIVSKSKDIVKNRII